MHAPHPGLVLVRFGLRFPVLNLLLLAAVTTFFTLQFPKVSFDNDPENMLPENEPVRVFHHEVKDRFGLYDFVIVGVVNETDSDGVFNPGTLGRIDRLTRDLLSLHQDEAGRPAIRRTDAEGNLTVVHPSLGYTSTKDRILGQAFHLDPERLFTETGQSAIIGPEIIAPSVVDNIRQADRGQLAVEYLMEAPPTTREQARVLRDATLTNPLYRDTLASSDGQAIGLYLPLLDKSFSHNVAGLVAALTEDWPAEDQVHITGLPVAEDTFGAEMLVQMATSAPLAGVMIFLLLLAFFRRIGLIIAPMLLALFTVLITMGLLIGGGHDVHIMSSMIAIFLMPIAVADSVHILSEFYDTYPRIRDKAETVRQVMRHLFRPMFFTSLTTAAGFGSLATTPIPPVQVFGLHVAFGVAVAWLLSMTFIPAYIMLFVRPASLDRLPIPHQGEEEDASHGSLMARGLERLGRFSRAHPALIGGAAALLAVVATWGVSRITVNDNPVNWFTHNHRIRVADRVLNHHFAGTYTAYLEIENSGKSGSAVPSATLAALSEDPLWRQAVDSGGNLEEVARQVDAGQSAGWRTLGDDLAYLDPEGLTVARIREQAGSPHLEEILRQLPSGLTGDTLLDAALAAVDRATPASLVEALEQARVEAQAPPFKQPAVLAWLDDLQQAMNQHPRVGKTNSAVDALKKAHLELNRDPNADPSGEVDRHYRIPDSAAATGQVYLQLEGMKKKDSLFHLVSRDYDAVNLWVQLSSGDNRDMESVVAHTEAWIADNPPPIALAHGWAGLTYINVVWQEKMVDGMLGSLTGSFVVVLVMMTVLFRSWRFGLLSMLPLSLTILLIYGIIGLVGKDYDMPVAVLSALTLGLSVDFAIHFLQRARDLMQETGGDWAQAAEKLFREPARAITRNAVVISVGFTPLLFAPLVPYRTVGFFIATIMAVSWLATLMLLTALITRFAPRLFTSQTTRETPS